LGEEGHLTWLVNKFSLTIPTGFSVENLQGSWPILEW